MTRNLYDPESCSWYRLKLDISDAVIPGVIESLESNQDMHIWQLEPQQILKPDWSAALPHTATSVLLFKRSADRADSAAHIDSAHRDIWTHLPASINWCLGPDLKSMQWWRPRSQHTSMTMTAPSGLPGDHLVWSLSDLDLIDQCIIGNTPTLVRIDQPHSIAQGQGQRICVSVRMAAWAVEWPKIIGRFADLIQL